MNLLERDALSAFMRQYELDGVLNATYYGYEPRIAAAVARARAAVLNLETLLDDQCLEHDLAR